VLLIGIATIAASFVMCAIIEWMAQGDNRGKFLGRLASPLKNGGKTDA